MSGFDTRHGQPIQAVYQHGMTLRDYFAVRAMQAFYTNYENSSDAISASNRAYEIADAMLKARNNDWTRTTTL